MGKLKDNVIKVVTNRKNWERFNKVFVPAMGALMGVQLFKMGHTMGEWTELERSMDVLKDVIDKE